jgi:hypothetical protein
MTLKQRIKGFAEVGGFISRHFQGPRSQQETPLHEGLEQVIALAFQYNNWFIPEFVKEAVQNLGTFLKEEELTTFTTGMPEKEPRTVALICAGNIPLVCFHDILCVLLSGNRVLIKLSSDDQVLLPFFLKLLVHYEPLFESRITFADGKLTDFQAVIATGSDNTATHLHYYFSKYPHIIRKSRSSAAILSGQESEADLKNLGRDIFLYFGLGCRNVSQLLVPENYSFDAFFKAMLDFGFVINNKKYGNNYDYHRAIYLLESLPFLDNNFLMVREQADLHSPVGVIHYQYYKTGDDIQQYLETRAGQLQCVVGEGHLPFGYSQKPVITDFADNVNTLDFLVNL